MRKETCGFSSSDFDVNKKGASQPGRATKMFAALFATVLASWICPSTCAIAQDDATPPLTAAPTLTADAISFQPQDSGDEPAVDPATEYGRLVRSPSATGALDNGLLGESVDFYTGQTDFIATDVSLPLNFNIPMAIGRRYHVDNHAGGVPQGAFGDWDLEIPHIEGIVANSVGWIASGAGYNECSAFSAPPSATVTTTVGTKNYATTIPSSEYAVGYSVVVPGKGRHELLLRSATNHNVPSGDFANYPVVTHDWWAATCSNLYDHYAGQPNESFQVTSPDGVTYDFGYYTSRPYPSYQRPADAAPAGTLAVLPRTQVFMLPFTITDRFGNWIKYAYKTDAHVLGNHILTGITSSDGHVITITYTTSGLISLIEDNLPNEGRQWKYTYTSGALTKVTLPDGSYWSIDFANLNKASWSYTNPTCTSLPTATIPTGSSISGGTVSGTIQHPTGASGTFTFAVTRHGRNGAPSTCLKTSDGVSFAALQPSVYDVLSLTKKTISGPKLPSALTWKIVYSGCTPTACNPTKTTLLIDARGYDTLYTFGAAYSDTPSADTEGQLQSVQRGGTGGGSYLETESFSYFSNCGASCPATMGTPTQLRGDVAPLSTLKPVQVRTIKRDGATYTQTASNSDAFGFPQTLTRTGTDTKTDTLTYKHDQTLWVLGSIVKSVSGGIAEMDVTLYADDLPEYIHRFGRLDRTYTYYDDGQVKTAIDGAGNTTTYSDYVAGIPQKVVYADATSESASVRYDGKILQWTDADGHITKYGYDAMGRLGSITYPSSGTESYADRDIAWNTAATGWSSTETAGTYKKITTYDAFLHPVLVAEDNTRFVNRSFDADGRTTFTSNPSTRSNETAGTTSIFDRLGRLSQQTDAGSHATAYTPGANQLIVKDRDSNQTTVTFKAYDEPSTAWPITIDTPIATTTIARDTWGKPTSITRGGITRTRHYNANQLVDKVVDPERHDTLTFDYDGANNLRHIYKNAVESETRTYDTRNRLTSIVYDNGDPNVSLAYWPDGLLKSSSRGGNGHTYAYNLRHVISAESITIDASTYTLGYAYDSLAHRSSMTYPDNTTITFAPNDLGQPSQIGTFATRLTYYPNGAIDTFTYGNGITHAMTQSSDGRQLPADVDDQNVFDLSYTYDDNALPTKISDALHSATTRTLGYDGGNRLHTANASGLWGNTTFSYDALDNLTQDVTAATTTSFPSDAGTNLPTAIKIGSTTTALTYDGEGNLKQKGSGPTATVYTFDSANELTQVTQGATTYRYTYDGSGLRATSSSDSVTTAGLQTDSIYNSAGQLVYESTVATGNPDRIFANGFEKPVAATQTTKYVYLGSHAIARQVTSGTTITDTYLHTDALGSPVAQTDKDRNVIGTTTYLPYGGLYASTGTGNAAGLGFAGQSVDATGLVYLRARYFDPQLRRFISLDPVDVDSSTALNFNRLSYADNNPFAKYDPSGREAGCITMMGLGASHANDCFDTGASLQERAVAMSGFAIGFGGFIGGAGGVLADIFDYGLMNALATNPAALSAGTSIAVDIGATLATGQVASTTPLTSIYHYTNSESAALIDAGGSIEPGLSSGKIWLTTDQYATAADAQSSLALPNTPNGYYQLPSYAVDNLSEPSVVEPAYGQPGGGIEMTTDQSIDISDIPFTTFGD